MAERDHPHMSEGPRGRTALSPDAERVALFDPNDADAFRTRWDAVQTGFVDEPRAAVEHADALVGEMLSRLTQAFEDQRRELDAQWERDNSVSTEDLRLALKRYRSFFERLLSL